MVVGRDTSHCSRMISSHDYDWAVPDGPFRAGRAEALVPDPDEQGARADSSTGRCHLVVGVSIRRTQLVRGTKR